MHGRIFVCPPVARSRASHVFLSRVLEGRRHEAWRTENHQEKKKKKKRDAGYKAARASREGSVTASAPTMGMKRISRARCAHNKGTQELCLGTNQQSRGQQRKKICAEAPCCQTPISFSPHFVPKKRVFCYTPLYSLEKKSTKGAGSLSLFFGVPSAQGLFAKEGGKKTSAGMSAHKLVEAAVAQGAPVALDAPRGLVSAAITTRTNKRLPRHTSQAVAVILALVATATCAAVVIVADTV